MSAAPLLQISALRIAALVHSRAASPLEIVDAHIARIEEVNPRINAVVAERFEAARREARSAGRFAGASAEKPLLGVPFTVKEMIGAAGMPMTFGCRSRGECTWASDSTVVARLRRAGAILLGVTNVPEWGMWPETVNDVYGETRNPHDVMRTPGGSSGGEGAIVAAGGAAFGIGSDIGGSIRIPAAFCGVVGHKPTSGLVPLTGHHPVYVSEAAGSRQPAHVPRSGSATGAEIQPYNGIGPLARGVEDAAAILRIIAGGDGRDPNARRLDIGDPGAVRWRGRRVLLLPAPDIRLAGRAEPALQQAVFAAGAVLEALGAEVVEAPENLLYGAGEMWASALQEVGGTPFAELLGAGRPVRVLPEVVAALLGRPRFSRPALYFLLAEALGRRGPRSQRRGAEVLRRTAAHFDDVLGSGGLLVMPVHPRPAPRLGTVIRRPFDFLYTAGLNALRVPATVVRSGFDRGGLPLAVQVTARQGEDHVTLAAAAALEAAFPPWTPVTPQPLSAGP